MTLHEIRKQAEIYEDYDTCDSDIVALEKFGKFHGFIAGAEWAIQSFNNNSDWQSVAEKLAEALDEFRTVSTLPNTEVFEKADKKCHSALNEYKKLKDDNTRI